jgi:hypothetical protein
MRPRPFPPPRTIEDIGGCFVVKASNDRHCYSSITGTVAHAGRNHKQDEFCRHGWTPPN